MNKTITLPIAAVAGLALALGAPLAASAHVTLDGNTASAGSYALLTFRVPNESATATTSTVAIELPDGITSVSYVPTPGWTADVTDTAVTFTADDAASTIQDGQLQLFRVSVGPVPDADAIEFPVEQTYTDGTVVAWDGSGDDPAPTLYVNAAPPTDDHHDSDDEADASVTAAATSGPDVLARVFGIVSLVVAAVALVIAIVRRRTVQ